MSRPGSCEHVDNYNTSQSRCEPYTALVKLRLLLAMKGDFHDRTAF